MQISDMLGQYNRNISNGTDELKSASNLQKVVSTLEELSAGSVFEGTVSSVRNGKVTLALSDGQMITARLAAKVALSEGTPMFFQVKNNDGMTMEIKPYTGAGSGGNPILMNALTEAGIMVNERNLTMVDFMMKEQMPIDKQSIANMARTANMNPQVSIATVVSMTKLGIPVSDELAAQFENYQTDHRAIMQEMAEAIEQLTEAAGASGQTPEQAAALNKNLLDILLPQTEGEIAENQQQTGVAEGEPAANQQKIGTAEGETAANQQQTGVTEGEPAANEQKTGTAEGETVAKQQFNGTSVAEGEGTGKLQQTGEAYANMESELLADALSEEQLSTLDKTLRNIPVFVENETLYPEAEQDEIFVDTLEDESVASELMAEDETEQLAEEKTTLNKNLTVKEFMQTVASAISKQEGMSLSGIQKLFGSKEYKTLLKDIIEQQWTIKPEELKEKNKVNELYERLDHQMKQMEQALQEAGITKSAFKDTASAVRSNIEFMNQLNQVYTYVQVPLKMSGQNVNSELYVYTNKKNLKNPDAEVSAFLHLDLENLGTTDVSVKMLHKNVKTNFYFADDASYTLVEKYVPVLEEKLKEKGYQCTITLSKEEKKMDFNEDFLRRDMPQQGMLHRYSFDVRA